MKKMIFLIAAALLAFPVIASADLVGDCYDCHTMHNSEQNAAVIATAQPNLLRYDCLGCHAQFPNGANRDWVGPGGSIIPQVAHNDPAGDKAGGNFRQGTGAAAGRRIHNVQDIVSAGIAAAVPLGENVNDQPPGIPHTSNRHVFTSESSTTAFNEFTCAGARGCHGSRSQILSEGQVWNGTANNWEISQRRVGIAAISGSHHNNIDNAKTGTGYNNAPAVHDGAVVADGYRFIVGLQGFENTAREYVNGTDHNEYFGNVTDEMGGGCGACHVQRTIGNTSSRAGFDSGIVSINNSMSGFCSSCHGYFHSSGGGDYVDNGVSGAFLRHPSDFVIPATGEYLGYTNYDPSAPVARPTVVTSASDSVAAGTDMVMCLSCHVAHGSANDYLLRFDYATMTAGGYQNADIVALNAAGEGGCLSCHTTKGVLPQDR